MDEDLGAENPAEFVSSPIVTLRIDVILLRLLRGLTLKCRGITGIYNIYGYLKDIVLKYYGDTYLDSYPASYILDYSNRIFGGTVLILVIRG